MNSYLKCLSFSFIVSAVYLTNGVLGNKKISPLTKCVRQCLNVLLQRSAPYLIMDGPCFSLLVICLSSLRWGIFSSVIFWGLIFGNVWHVIQLVRKGEMVKCVHLLLICKFFEMCSSFKTCIFFLLPCFKVRCNFFYVAHCTIYQKMCRCCCMSSKFVEVEQAGSRNESIVWIPII